MESDGKVGWVGGHWWVLASHPFSLARTLTYLKTMPIWTVPEATIRATTVICYGATTDGSKGMHFNRAGAEEHHSAMAQRSRGVCARAAL